MLNLAFRSQEQLFVRINAADQFLMALRATITSEQLGVFLLLLVQSGLPTGITDARFVAVVAKVLYLIATMAKEQEINHDSLARIAWCCAKMGLQFKQTLQEILESQLPTLTNSPLATRLQILWAASELDIRSECIFDAAARSVPDELQRSHKLTVFQRVTFAVMLSGSGHRFVGAMQAISKSIELETDRIDVEFITAAIWAFGMAKDENCKVLRHLAGQIRRVERRMKDEELEELFEVYSAVGAPSTGNMLFHLSDIARNKARCKSAEDATSFILLLLGLAEVSHSAHGSLLDGVVSDHGEHLTSVSHEYLAALANAFCIHRIATGNGPLLVSQAVGKLGTAVGLSNVLCVTEMLRMLKHPASSFATRLAGDPNGEVSGLSVDHREAYVSSLLYAVGPEGILQGDGVLEATTWLASLKRQTVGTFTVRVCALASSKEVALAVMGSGLQWLHAVDPATLYALAKSTRRLAVREDLSRLEKEQFRVDLEQQLMLREDKLSLPQLVEIAPDLSRVRGLFDILYERSKKARIGFTAEVGCAFLRTLSREERSSLTTEELNSRKEVFATIAKNMGQVQPTGENFERFLHALAEMGLCQGINLEFQADYLEAEHRQFCIAKLAWLARNAAWIGIRRHSLYERLMEELERSSDSIQGSTLSRFGVSFAVAAPSLYPRFMDVLARHHAKTRFDDHDLIRLHAASVASSANVPKGLDERIELTILRTNSGLRPSENGHFLASVRLGLKSVIAGRQNHAAVCGYLIHFEVSLQGKLFAVLCDNASKSHLEWDYCSERLQGAALLQRKVLEAKGYQVVRVTQQQWSSLSEAARRSLLRIKLELRKPSSGILRLKLFLRGRACLASLF